MSTSAAAIANYFIEKGLSDGVIDMTPMKIQKLVYLAHGWALALLNRDLLDGEEIEAWDHGPVIPSLYHSLKHHKSNNVSDLIEEDFSIIDEDGMDGGRIVPRVESNDRVLIELLDSLWSVFKAYSPSSLRDLTHRHNTPWEMHYRKNCKGIVIPNETIKAFYELLSAKS